MLMTDELFRKFGFDGEGGVWKHKEYYPKYGYWVSSRRIYSPVSIVIKELVELSLKDAFETK